MPEQERQKPQPTARIITLPRRTLLVLCGTAGCGKSTFAAKLVERAAPLGLRPTSIVSSDQCRAFVCDDESNQHVNRDTFDLFHFIIHKRMFQNVFTIADSTALQADARRRLLDLAHRHSYATCLFIFETPLATCLQRDQQRARSVGPAVITYHTTLLQQTLRDAPYEGWQQFHILNGEQAEITLEILSVE